MLFFLLTFNGKICLICTVGRSFGVVNTFTVTDAIFPIAALLDWHVIFFWVLTYLVRLACFQIRERTCNLL